MLSPKEALRFAQEDRPEIQAARIVLREERGLRERFSFLSSIDAEARNTTLTGLGVVMQNRYGLVPSEYWALLAGATLAAADRPAAAQATAQTPAQTPAPSSASHSQHSALEKNFARPSIKSEQEAGDEDKSEAQTAGEVAAPQETEQISAGAASGAEDSETLNVEELKRLKAEIAAALEKRVEEMTLSKVAVSIGESRNTLVRLMDPNYNSSESVILRMHEKLSNLGDFSAAAPTPSDEQTADQDEGGEELYASEEAEESEGVDTEEMIRELIQRAKAAYTRTEIRDELCRIGPMSTITARFLIDGFKLKDPMDETTRRNVRLGLIKMARQGDISRDRSEKLWARLENLSDGRLNREELVQLLSKAAGKSVRMSLLDKLRTAEAMSSDQLDVLERIINAINPQALVEGEDRSAARVRQTRRYNHLSRRALEDARSVVVTLSKKQLQQLLKKQTTEEVRAGIVTLSQGRILTIQGESGPGELALTPEQAEVVAAQARAILRS